MSVLHNIPSLHGGTFDLNPSTPTENAVLLPLKNLSSARPPR